MVGRTTTGAARYPESTAPRPHAVADQHHGRGARRGGIHPWDPTNGKAQRTAGRPPSRRRRALAGHVRAGVATVRAFWRR